MIMFVYIRLFLIQTAIKLFSTCVYVHCVTLTPSEIDVWEDSNVTMNCTDNTQYFRAAGWERNGENVAMEQNATMCRAYKFLLDQALYSFSCPDNYTFSVTLKKISYAVNGDKWKCLDIHKNESNVVTIFVKVPIRIVTLLPRQTVFTMAENGTLSSIQCKSSKCRPAPIFLWYKDHNTNSKEDDILLMNYTTDSTSTNEIQYYISEFNHAASKSLNGWYLFCVAKNKLDDDIIISEKILLNITYPPDKPPRIGESEKNEEYRVIEGTFVTQTCSVTGGNPLPQLEWNRNGNVSETLTDGTLAKTISWQASRADQTILTCTSIHPIRNETKQMNVTVLYPPDKPVMTLQSLSGTSFNLMDAIYVIERTPFNVKCNANSHPPVSTFQWSGLTFSKNSSVYIGIANRNHTNLTCRVFNQMKESSSDQTVTGTNSTSLEVNVLYPPKVHLSTEEMTIQEGDNFIVWCNVTSGNPNATNVKWSRADQIWDDQQITLYKVSRYQAGVYQCCAQNMMVTPDGIKADGNDCVNIYLHVQYKTEVLNFIANNTSEILTVSENHAINVTCEVEGNPIPEGDITFQEASFLGNNRVEEKTITSTKRTSVNLHLITTFYANCTDAGKYTCTGRNTLNNGLKTVSVRNLTLFVNCSPRTSPYHDIPNRVFSAITREVTLSFTALAYPVPPESGYVWSKKTVYDNWTTINVISKDERIILATDGLQSNLTIKNITQSDYGIYQLMVKNDVGTFEHTFNLDAEDINESFQLSLAAISVICSAAILVVFFVAFAVCKIRYKGVKHKKTTIARREAIDEHCATEMTGQLEHATIVQHTFSISRQSLSQQSSQLLPLIRKPAATDAVYYDVEESDHYADVQDLYHFEKTTECNRNCDTLELDNNGDKKNLDHNRDLQDQDQHCNHEDLDVRGEYQDLDYFDGLQELENYDDPQKLYDDEQTHAEYGNTLEIVKQIERVHVTELFSYLNGTTKDYFETQFTKLPKGLTNTYSFSQKPENIPLNRYHGIYPYDHSRVKIHSIPDFFINACYIDGFESEKAYIACLGPMANTTNNFAMFWQMVWSEDSDVIVMLTMLVEHSGVKCEKYWPNNGESISYGDFTVTSAEEEIYSDYIIKKFEVNNGGEIRNITHFHFTAWPDKSVPEDLTCILEFRRRVRKLHTRGPLIVHCSAGIGRTGTLIAIDILIDEGRSQGSVNVFGCVKKMREQRVNMVQTLEQYHFIYKTLVNALVFDSEAVTANDLCTYTDISKTTNFSEMFKTLDQSVESESTEESRTRNVNTEYRYGNRDGSDIPGDAHRVRLFLSREMSSSDYINAVYVNSYTKADHFIVAQSPLPNSVEDFLCLIYQAECTCVVSMDGEVEGQIAGLYLPPDNSNVTVGNFAVTCRRLDSKDSCIVREVKIALNGMFKGAEKVVYHFQYMAWLNGHRVPSCPKKFVEFVRNVENCFQQFGNESCHILVHCLNAFERSCLFCAVVALTETVQHEGEVCIPNTLRRIRTRRRRAVPNMEQFRFCFQAGRAYIETETEGDNTYMICY